MIQPMRKILLLGALLTSSLWVVSSQNSRPTGQSCRVGLEYQMSYDDTWGANRPVILSIQPSSPAARAGIRVGDIIESVNGTPLTDMSEQDFVAQLTQTSNSVSLEVSNFGYKKQLRTLTPECHSRELLNERQLAQVFSLYSLEDESDRAIIYPFDTGREPKISLENVATFSFADNSATDSRDHAINKAIRKHLESIGLRYDVDNPDLVIDIYYTLSHNPYFDAKKAKNNTIVGDMRIDPYLKKLTQLPLLPVGADKQVAPYILTLGIRIFNSFKLNTLLWSCEAVEHLLTDYPIEEYATLTAPIMLEQFPFIRYNVNPRWRMASHRYHYTGIYLRASDLGQIAYVVPNSPADKAGIRTGDVIVAINNKPMNMLQELSNAYRDFADKTLSYRKRQDAFNDTKGAKGCRYWAPEHYKKIASIFQKEKYLTTFSYLFSFRPYIQSEQEDTFSVFDVLSEGITKRIEVLPELKDESFFCLD